MKDVARLRSVVFDLDGTILDSLPLVLQSAVHALEPFTATTPAEVFARLGGPPARFLSTFVADPLQVAEAVSRMEAYHRAHLHRIIPFAGTREFLDGLRAGGMGVGLWTGRDRASTAWLLQEQAIAGCFDAMVCGDDLPTHKPDPGGLLEVLRRLNVRPAEALFIGDADVDVRGGAAAGVSTILIRHGRPVAAEIATQCLRVVEDPAGAFAWVRERFFAATQTGSCQPD